jgi:sporulation integral membrane protein YlbJ
MNLTTKNNTASKKFSKKNKQNASSSKNKRSFTKAGIILFLAVILIFPSSSYLGAKKGLLLWFNTVLPTLLPFIIVSNLVIALQITKPLSKILYPVFHFLFGISRGGCYPVLMGFLSGIPVGAKSVADLVNQGTIDEEEGQYLLAFCNNASPMFIMSYIAISQLKLPEIRFHLLLIIYLSGILSAFLLFRLFPKQNGNRKFSLSAMEFGQNCSRTNTEAAKFDFSLLDNSIMNSFEIITKVGGYIILFSIPAQIIATLGTDESYLKLLITGFLEITTGINNISLSNLGMGTKIALISMITAFGGLSGAAQTKSVINSTRLSIGLYIKSKLLHMLIAFTLTEIYVRFILYR